MRSSPGRWNLFKNNAAIASQSMAPAIYSWTRPTRSWLRWCFTELATNAVKYGALSNGDGCVNVAWKLIQPDRVKLIWRESGGPKISPPKPCAVLFLQNSFRQRLHLSSTFFSIHHSQRKRPGGDLPARIHVDSKSSCRFEEFRRENGNPIQKNDG
jgi:hypothetical protein